MAKKLNAALRKLRLSRSPGYAGAEPKEAAAYAQTLAKVLAKPHIREAFRQSGISPDQLLDAPLSELGVKQARSTKKPFELPFAESIGGLGMSSETAHEISAGAHQVLAGFGITEGPPPTADAAKFPEGTPLVGGQPITRTLASFAGNMALTYGTLGVSRLATQGLRNLAAKGAASHGMTFGGLETIRQIGRKAGQGEDFQPGNIAYESIMGVAAGIPASRVGAALMAGVPAAGMAAAGVVPFEQAGAEVAAALLFGNPRINEPRPAKPDLPSGKPPDPLSPPPPKEKSIFGDDLDAWQESQVDRLKRAAKEAPTAAEATAAAKQAEVVENLAASHPPEVLDKVADTAKDPLVAKVAADAHAQVSGETRPVNAPAKIRVQPTKPPPNMEADAQAISVLASDEPYVRVHDTGGPGKGPDSTGMYRQADEYAKLGDTSMSSRMRWLAKQKELNNISNPPPAGLAEQTFLRSYAEKLDPADQHSFNVLNVAEDIGNELRLADNELLALRSQTSPEPGVIKAAEERRAKVKARLTNVLEGNLEIATDIQAAQTVQAMLNGLTSPKAVDNFWKSPPTELKPYVEQLEPVVAAYKKSMQTDIERNNFLNDINYEARRLGMMGLEIVDQFEDTARTLAASINVVGYAKGDMRRLGGVSKMMNSILEEVDNPEILRWFEKATDAQKSQLVKRVNQILFEPKKSRLTDERLTQDAFSAGYRLQKAGPKYILRAGGYAKDFTSKKQVREFLDGDGAGSVIALEAAANDRNVYTRYVGDGEYKWKNWATGEEGKGSYEDLNQAIVGAPNVRAAAPDLTPNTPVRQPGVTARKPDNVDSLHWDMAEVQGRLPSNWLTKGIRELGKLSQDIEAVSGLPIYNKFWIPVRKALEARTEAEFKPIEDLNKIRRLVRKRNKSAIQETFLSRTNEAEMIQRHGLNPKEVQAIESLREWYRAMEVDPFDLEILMKKMRGWSGDRQRWVRRTAMPRNLEWLRDGLYSGKVALELDDPFALAFSVLRAKTDHFIMRKSVQQGEKFLRALDNVNRKKSDTKYRREDIRLAQDMMQKVLDRVKGSPDGSMLWLAKVLAPAFKRGLGTDINVKSLEKTLDSYAQFFSGSAMALRPALVVRNFTQSLLPAWKVGYKPVMDAHSYIGKNWRKAFQEAEDAGAIAKEYSGIYLMEDAAQLDAGIARRWQKIGLVPYRFMDRYNRVASYHAGRLAFESALSKGGSQQATLLRSGLIGSSITVQNQIAKLMNTGQAEQAAKEYGKHVAMETQYLYAREAAPLAFQGVAGRLIGQFGIWPMSYIEYVGRNMGVSSSVGKGVATDYTVKSGFGKGMTAQGMYRTQFAMRAIAMLGALHLVKELTDVDTSSFNFANPLDFEGGPVYQVFRDSLTLVGGNDFEKDLARRNMSRALQNFAIPFRSFGIDIQQAVEAEDPVDSLLLGLGFNLTGERAKRTR